MRTLIPTAGLLSAHSFDCVKACLKADGHPLLSTLMYEWVFEADEKRRREIDAIVEGAIWSTMHKWA
jgi:hypothetical protein